VIRPRETIDAAMLASTIRIDAGIETDIRAVVVADDSARLVFEKDRVDGRVAGLVPLGPMIGRLFESIRRITSRPAASQLFSTHGRYYNSTR